MSAACTKETYLATRFRRPAARRGKKRALVATGHSILISVWTMPSRNVPYHDLGPDHFTQRFNAQGKARQIRRLVDQLGSLGLQVTIHPRAEATKPQTPGDRPIFVSAGFGCSEVSCPELPPRSPARLPQRAGACHR